MDPEMEIISVHINPALLDAIVQAIRNSGQTNAMCNNAGTEIGSFFGVYSCC